MPRVLFLCTGNYYRSRFAESLFNWRAGQLGLSWTAESRGLGIDMEGVFNVGPISQHVLDALRSRGIPIESEPRFPVAVTAADLSRSDLIIALKEAEHRRLLEPHVPDGQGNVEYWHIHDLDCATAETALPQIEAHVEALVARLAAGGRR